MMPSWRRGDEWYLYTEDGRFTIAATYDATHVVYLLAEASPAAHGVTWTLRASRRRRIDDTTGRRRAVAELQEEVASRGPH